MQKATLAEIDVGEHLVLARPVILGSGVKGFNSGVQVTDWVVQKLRDLGFSEVWVRGENEARQDIIGDGDEEPVSQTEKFFSIKQEFADTLAEIMTEKAPEREMLRLRSMTRSNVKLEKGALTKLDPNRSASEIKLIKQFSEAVISTARLEKFLSQCRDLLEGPFSQQHIDKTLVNLNDNRIEGSYLFNHMANCGLYFLATVARHNVDLKARGAVSSDLKYAAGFDHKKRKETLFFYSDEEILSGALAAFTHDIGYLHDGMPDLLFKQGVITPEEHNILKKHVEVSMNIVQYHNFFENRPLARHVIENHHERLDGKGYPKARKNFHVFSSILGMIDCFDSMVTDRPWRKKFARAKVLEWLFDNSAQRSDTDGSMREPMFDREMLLCFERILMLYECGEIVDLYHVKTTTPVFKCRVKEFNPGRPDRPAVELLHCYADPNKDVAGKTLNLLNTGDLYLGESTDFRKERIY
jgi:hypothetical protein